MKSLSDSAFSALQRTLLHSAALLVPSPEREEWNAEWSAELWHVRRTCFRIDDTFSLESHWEIIRFCLGAFPDALCIREHSAKSGPQHAHIHGSAAQALLWLASILLLCFLITTLLPGVG